MGRELYDRLPGVRDRPGRGVRAVRTPALEWHTLFGSASPPCWTGTEYTQPALFAVEVALFRLLESWGLKPDFVVRAFGSVRSPPRTWRGSCRWTTRARSSPRGPRLMQELPAGGVMIAVQASEDEVLPLLTDRVSIAAVNGPASVVIAGDEDAATAIVEAFARREVQAADGEPCLPLAAHGRHAGRRSAGSRRGSRTRARASRSSPT
ncbi:hypothetical protein [Streptomyces lavendulae]